MTTSPAPVDLTSPGAQISLRAQFEAQVASDARAALAALLRDVGEEATAALDSPVLLAAGFRLPGPFTLGAVLRLWDTFTERVGRSLVSVADAWRARGAEGPVTAPQAAPTVPTPSPPGALTLAQRLGVTDPYMIATLDRLARMDLPEQIHTSVASVLTEAQQQQWKRKDIRTALLRALDPTSGIMQRELDAEKGLGSSGVSWESIADRLARTESTALFTHLTETEIARMNYPGKRWVSVRDNRVRPTHAAANGQSRRVGEAFIVGGYAMQGPGDPAAPTSERANCRCILIALGRNASRSAGII